MVKILEKYQSNINLSNPISIRGLKLIPINFESQHLFENIEIMDSLFKKDQLEVKEIGEGGLVNKVNIFNKSSSDLFIIDGQIITGAKQNRIAHRSAVIPCFSEIIFPVHCIERGRWSYRENREFSGGKFSAGPKMRSDKNIHSKFSEQSAQSAVWENVNNLSLEMDISSETDDMEYILEKSRLKPISLEMDKIEKSKCNGYLVLGAGRPFVEIFSDKKVCKSHTRKSLSSWLADSDSRFYDNDNFYQSKKIKNIDKSLIEKFKSKIIDSSWKTEQPIGKEDAYESIDETGKAIFLDGELLHCYYYL